MESIIREADERGMVVLVGMLYWGNSKGKWEHWTQIEANRAVIETMNWISQTGYRNVFVDPDNEGMAERAMGFDTSELIRVAQLAAPDIAVSCNSKSCDEASDANLHIHFAPRLPDRPYIESEGTVSAGTPDGYWRSYSKQEGVYNYINVGIHNEAYKAEQIRVTEEHLARGDGYMLASTWLQAAPPKGPHPEPGGSGTAENPGIKWWLDFVKSYLEAS
jgi:hypothetical protein